MKDFQDTCNICKIIKKLFYTNMSDEEITPPVSPLPYKRDQSLIQRGLPYRK